MPEKYLEVFEGLSHKNDITYWLSSDLMCMLGYESKPSFRKAISRAQVACANLNIPVEENFVSFLRDDGTKDTKLSRFACYLVAMNADSRKEEVARIQAYLATLAESVRKYIEQADNVIRVPLRGEITEREKSLAGVAKTAGVDQFAFFQNAGYLGMYNMTLAQLRRMRDIPNKRSPLDFMGKTELAANLFRITQTEERIKSEGVRGQQQCEETAKHVGKRVRQTMRELSNTVPEELPKADDIRVVRRELKEQHKRLKRVKPAPATDENVDTAEDGDK